ncbi:MAG: MFS transporter [Planctomycetaceae bacterium]|nr:MFS transporter [Planctomycetaceae bacterium]
MLTPSHSLSGVSLILNLRKGALVSDPREQEEFPAPGYAWYVVAVLTIAYVFSFIDRQIMNFLVGPIRRDLGISDTQISLLMGLSFAIFYTLFGIPLGRLADTRSRRGIISIGIAVWSLMTVACGMTRNFWQLALTRMGVGVGEAALSPAAYSLIADYFPPTRRATAMSVYSMGIYVGAGLASILGGWIAGQVAGQESYVLPLFGAMRSWQIVFIAVGVPGLLVALLLLTVREPVRRGPSRSGKPAAPATIGETLAYVSDNASTFIFLNLAIAFLTLNSYASTSWIPSLFERRFGWSKPEIGLVYGSVIAISGSLGVVGGGWLSDWWAKRGHVDAPVRVAWVASMCWLPSGLLYPLAPDGWWTAALLVPTVFFGSMPYGVAPAAIQRMMPNTMRAQATAIYLFVINIIGMGLGPTVVALLSDHVFHDENRLHHSLVIVGGASYVVATVLLAIARHRYRRSIEYLEDWSRSQSASH